MTLQNSGSPEKVQVLYGEFKAIDTFLSNIENVYLF